MNPAEQISELESQLEDLRNRFKFHISHQQEPMVHMVISRLMQRANGATLVNLTALFNLIRMGRQHQIDAMKSVRVITGCSLKEAKDFIHWVHDCEESA